LRPRQIPRIFTEWNPSEIQRDYVTTYLSLDEIRGLLLLGLSGLTSTHQILELLKTLETDLVEDTGHELGELLLVSLTSDAVSVVLDSSDNLGLLEVGDGTVGVEEVGLGDVGEGARAELGDSTGDLDVLVDDNLGGTSGLGDTDTTDLGTLSSLKRLQLLRIELGHVLLWRGYNRG